MFEEASKRKKYKVSRLLVKAILTRKKSRYSTDSPRAREYKQLALSRSREILAQALCKSSA